MTKVGIKKVSVDEWMSFDFVKYFYSKCETAYGADKVTKDVDADCMRIKRIIDLFEMNGRYRIDVKAFLDWSFTFYQKNPQYVLPITISFLSCLVRDYLGLARVGKKKKKKRPDVVLPDDMQAWIEEEKKKLEKPNV
jgi:hypothetical protein